MDHSAIPTRIRVVENPIVCREFRSLYRQMRDWRLWLGLRLPREARGCGLPVITWFAIHPYVVWIGLLLLWGLTPSAAMHMVAFEIDLFAGILLVLGLYACVITALVGATSVVRERERETWEQVVTTPLTNAELVIGYWAAGAAPPAAGVALSMAAWLAFYSHYLPLLEPLGTFTLGRADLFWFGILLLARMAGLSALGLLFSAFCRHEVAAIAATIVAVAGALTLDVLVLSGSLENELSRAPVFPILLFYTAMTALSLRAAAACIRRF